jgi:gliding motility-associated-like protein
MTILRGAFRVIFELRSHSNKKHPLSIKMIRTILTLLFLSICVMATAIAQDNLVPNWNFETVDTCGAKNIPFPVSRYWFSPQATPIPLDTTCFYGVWWAGGKDTFGLNKSRGCYFETFGLFSQMLNISHHRAYLAVKLNQPLTIGQRYYFEMTFRTLDTVPDVNWITTDFTDGQDLAFTKEFPTYDWNQANSVMPLTPVLQHPLVTDYEWHKLKGCFTAQGGERFLIIGNFRDNATTRRVPTGKRSRTQFISSSFVVDNVVLTPVQMTLRDTAICANNTANGVVFDAKHPYLDSLQYRWHDGSTTPQYRATKTERVSVEITFDKNCVATAQANFRIIDATYRSKTLDTAICRSDTISLQAGTGLVGETIRWQNGATAPKITVRTEGVFLAEIRNACASWTDTFRIRMQNCGFEVFVPTVFSPNADNVNDLLQPFFKKDLPKMEAYEWQIFNRWGNLIFKSQNPTDFWDGTFQGQTCKPDVYVWTLVARLPLNGKIQTVRLAGEVNLVR